MYGQTDGLNNGQTDGLTGRTDGRTLERMNARRSMFQIKQKQRTV